MKKLNELNVEELKMVYENNEKLRGNVFDDYCEDQMMFAGEILDGFKEYLRDYSISFPIAYRDFIKTKGDYRIFEAVLEVQNECIFLNDNNLVRVKEMQELYKELENLDNLDIDDDTYYSKEEELTISLDDCLSELEDILLESVEDFTGIAEENLKYYFIEFYIDARMEKENFYITDELELMEHIEYEKSYA